MKQEFADSIDSYDSKLNFQDMKISRPLMKVSCFWSFYKIVVRSLKTAHYVHAMQNAILPFYKS